MEREDRAILRSAQIQTQSFCNASCVMCPYPMVVNWLSQGEMPTGLFRKIIDELLTDFPSLKIICLTLQNEPLLDRDLPEKVLYVAKKRGKKKFPKISLVTNGTLLQENEIDKSLIKSGLDKLTISLNATSQDIYKNINKEFSVKDIIKSINSLVSLKTKKLEMVLRFILLKCNIDEIFRFLGSEQRRRWAEKGLKFEIIPFVNTACLIKKPKRNLLIRNKINTYFVKCRKAQNQKPYCAELFYKLNIIFNGDVLLCCYDWSRLNVIGNAGRNRLKDIWEGEEMNFLRKKIIAGEYNSIFACSRCSLSKLYS